jgi:hypothetical protein
MPEVGFEPTITASERAKTVHALDYAATVIGTNRINLLKFYHAVSGWYPIFKCRTYL